MRLTVIQYAKLAGFSKATAYRHVKSGRLKTEKNDGVTYVILDETDLESLDETGETERDSDEKMRLSEEIDRLHEIIREKDNQIDKLHEQLSEKDTQISQLHQLVAMEQKNLGEMTQQLAQSQNQLEDLRKPRPWWQRWKRK